MTFAIVDRHCERNNGDGNQAAALTAAWMSLPEGRP